MSITLQVNGINYSNFLDVTVNMRLDQVCKTFSFGATVGKGQRLPFLGGEACKVLVDGHPVLTGFIDVVDVSYDASSHNISISGRDKTSDLIDSTIGPISDLSAPITLKQIVQKVIQNIGATIGVVDKTQGVPFDKATDLVAPEAGESAFSFLDKLAREKQALLTSDGDGNLVLQSPTPRDSKAVLKNRVGNFNNNILSANASYDITGRFNVYKFVSGLNPVLLATIPDIDISSVVSQSGEVTDQAVRLGRQRVLVAESPNSGTQNEKRAQWEANIRKARGRVYSAQVFGFKDNLNNLWELNTLVNIADDFAGIDAAMLLNSITFNYDLSTGSTTTLAFIEKNAYTLTLEEPKTEKIAYELFS